MPSFDTVCEANLVEVKNAVENTAKDQPAKTFTLTIELV